MSRSAGLEALAKAGEVLASLSADLKKDRQGPTMAKFWQTRPSFTGVKANFECGKCNKSSRKVKIKAVNFGGQYYAVASCQHCATVNGFSYPDGRILYYS